MPASTGDIRDMGSIPGSERSTGVGNGNPLQYSCLETPMDRGAWRAAVHRVAKSWTQLKWLSMHVHTLLYIHPLFSSLIHLSIFAGWTCPSPLIPCIIHLTINTTPVHFSQSCRISFLVSSSLFCWWLSSSELWFGSPLIPGPKNLKLKINK